MRLIDADAVIEKLLEYVVEMESDIYYGSNLGIPEDCICEAIEEVPTVKAEPMRHGKWINNKHTDTVICSQCKRCFSDETPYCPNCGAKMKGEENGKI